MPVQLEIKDNIGRIVFDLPDSKVNILTPDVLKKFDALLGEAAGKADLKALLIESRKKDVFIAGADIKEIQGITDPEEGEKKAAYGQEIFNKLEDMKVPTVAVIDGVALGGGCELALACDYRVATFNPKVRIGLPEVNLGVLPGFGGSYRMPRLVGLTQGLTLILTGKPVDGAKAFKIGLVDRVVPSARLDKHVGIFLDDLLNGRLKSLKKPRRKPKGINAFLEGNRLGHAVIFSQSRKNVLQKTKGHFPAPLEAIEVIKKNYYAGRERGLKIEAEGFGRLSVTKESKISIHLFYLFEKYRKLSVEGGEDVKGIEIERCGVLGAGVMGGGIAQIMSSVGIWTRLKDINYEAVAKGYQAAGKVYSQAVKKRKMRPHEAEAGMARITSTLDYSGFQNLDIVIEAVVEKMEVKKKVFKELSEVTPEKTVLATNTSALSVTEMAKETRDPSKVIGFHFFNPVHRMPLVEIITAPETSRETLVTSLNLVKRLKKTPIIVKDSCGFIVNRILLGYINEAGRILEETGDLERIDETIVGFGMPMGPFTLSDEVGLDVGVKVMQILEDAFGKKFRPVETFNKVVDKGLLGKKSGKGFYIHEGKKKKLNPEAGELVVRTAERPFDKEECIERMIHLMVNEAAMCLQEGIVDEAGAIDVGMIMGTGFPLHRGGLLKYADDRGIDEIVASLQKLEGIFQDGRFQPCDYLLEMKEKNTSFFESS